jgi:hypothetical protein
MKLVGYLIKTLLGTRNLEIKGLALLQAGTFLYSSVRTTVQLFFQLLAPNKALPS